MARPRRSPQGEFEIKVVGKSGQISLGKRFAGKVLRLDRLEDGSVLLTAVAIVPESQLWTVAEPDRPAIERGPGWPTPAATATTATTAATAASAATTAVRTGFSSATPAKPRWSERFSQLAGSARDFPYPEEPSAVEPGPELA